MNVNLKYFRANKPARLRQKIVKLVSFLFILCVQDGEQNTWYGKRFIWATGALRYTTIARFKFQDLSEHKKGNPAVAVRTWS